MEREKMADRWAAELAATLLSTDQTNSGWGLSEDDPEHREYMAAVDRLISSLRKKAGSNVKWPSNMSV